MMDWNQQLKLQAYLDGELSEKEAREVEFLLQQDPEASGLAAELRNTKEAVAVFAGEIRLPESREFHWSKISREIQKLEKQPDPESVPFRISWVHLLRRALVPVTAVAVVILAGFLFTREASHGTETLLDDSGAFTYHDFANGSTLVWLTYPAEDGLPSDDEAAMFE